MMTDFKIKQGLYDQLFTAPNVLNPKVVVELGCWYLCTDTADLFLGTTDNAGELVLKRINGESTKDQPTNTPSSGSGELEPGLIGAYIDDETGELYIIFSDGTEESLGVVVGKPGVTPSIQIGNTFYEHTDGIIKLPDFATKDFVINQISNSLKPAEANKVLFTTSQIVTKPIGDFTQDEDIQGLTIAQVFAKLLGLKTPDHVHNFINGKCECGEEDPTYVPPSDTPPATIAEAIEQFKNGKLIYYQADKSGDLVPVPANYLTLNAESYAGQVTQAGFYQVLNNDGQVVESGIHQFTASNINVPYMIALPEVINFSTDILVKQCDINGLTGAWQTVTLALESDPDFISDFFINALGTVVPSVAPGYKLWLGAGHSNDGSIYRLVIKEGSVEWQ